MAEATCLFCRIAQRHIPAAIVAETEDVLAFDDIHPQAPTHVLLIPKTHIPSLNDLQPAQASLMGSLTQLANRLAHERHITQGYRLVVNCGPQAGQSVSHLHVHLLGGRTLQWPPG